MPLPIYRLRRLLAATAILLTAIVAGMYFYARSKATNALKNLPGELGYDIKETANGFQISKSDGKRTLFSVQASRVKEFKLNALAELHDVSIIVYGRDSSRYDHIYGDDFAFDQKTGDVTAKGEVQIDLVSNPAGLTSADQSAPKELKNPIHLKTRDLIFNKDSGDAWTNARVDFRTTQAEGWAVGVKYAGKSNTLTLSSQIHVTLSGAHAATIEAEHGVITNDPHEVTLDHPRLERKGGTMVADLAVFHLNHDNNVERVDATGNVTTEAQRTRKESAEEEGSEIHSRADQAEFLLNGKENFLRTATLTGNVHVEQSGAQPMQGDAGRVVLDFAGQNELQKVHALDGAHLSQRGVRSKTSPTSASRSASSAKGGTDSGPQDFDLTAPVIDFTLAGGNVLERAETSGAAQITIASAQREEDVSPSSTGKTPQKTVITAGRFVAKFTGGTSPTSPKNGETPGTYGASSSPQRSKAQSYLSSIHGEPDARIVNSSPSQPDRVSTSNSVDAMFLPQGGIDFVTQTGNVAYTDQQSPDKRTQAWANSARYTPADQILILTGSPRVESGSMETTAKIVRMNRATGEAQAEGDVKTTYSEVKEQPNGALLASSSPIHVTARTMAAQNNSGIALYTGNVRLWQDANIIEAPSIQFDRDHRFVTAQGTATAPVLTTLVQTSKSDSKVALTAGNSEAKTKPLGSASPIAITAPKLTYADSERKVHYEGGVKAKGIDFTADAKTADAYLLPRSQTIVNQKVTGPNAGSDQLDHITAEGDVVVQEPNRRAEGQKLVYTAADDKFVLTGGPPSIFDAEHGKITGVSLTFFRRDDRVLVEGEAKTPVVTQSRVAK
jgi:lipopolysaccharide export system protein LptA